MQESCRFIESQLIENRDELRLFCQQFAYAPEMVEACGKVLICRDTELDKVFFSKNDSSNQVADINPTTKKSDIKFDHN